MGEKIVYFTNLFLSISCTVICYDRKLGKLKLDNLKEVKLILVLFYVPCDVYL